jgi:peptidoglycan/LPS O-acetylase OafA/YrhL
MKGRVRALDGVRGLALIAVLGYHSLPGTFRGGFLGVDLFFVLSGFLLTSLLLDEHARTGGIDRRRFGARRVRRLAPAGFVVLLALAIFGPIVASDTSARLRGDLLWSAVGLTNWHFILSGTSYFSHVGRPPLVRHFWSLAIEVQFYVVCPFLVAWLARQRKKTACLALCGGIAASALAMWILYRTPDPYRAYYGTDTRAGALLAGVLLAVLLTETSYARIIGWLAGPGLVVLAVLFFIADERSRLLYPEGFLLTQAAAMGLIAACISGGGVERAFRARPLRWLGERSYGIYLWHWPLVALLRPRIDVGWPAVVTAAVTISFALVIGAFSYRFVELPFLRGAPPARHARTIRRRLAVSYASGMLALGLLAGLSLRLPTHDPIAASLEAGARVLAAQAPGSAADGSTAAPSETALPSTPTQTQLPPVRPAAAHIPLRLPRLGTLEVSAIGDSVMLGAAGSLHTRLGNSSYIDAAKNRQFGDALSVIRSMRASGRLGRAVVIHLGNNGPPRSGEIEALIRELRDVRTILFVTVRVDKGWQDQVNDAIRSGSTGRPGVRVVDWFAYSSGHRDWFWSDGTHLRANGAAEYAKLLASAVPPEPKPTAAPAPAATPAPTPTPGLLPKIP